MGVLGLGLVFWDCDWDWEQGLREGKEWERGVGLQLVGLSEGRMGLRRSASSISIASSQWNSSISTDALRARSRRKAYGGF